MTPLEDPRYTPEHPPVNGGVPDVVAKWGPRSQVRWFRRYWRETRGIRSYAWWDRFYPTSVSHRGLCCDRCEDEIWQEPDCCCRSNLLS